jgi:hypothetical protein
LLDRRHVNDVAAAVYRRGGRNVVLRLLEHPRGHVLVTDDGHDCVSSPPFVELAELEALLPADRDVSDYTLARTAIVTAFVSHRDLHPISVALRATRLSATTTP